MTSPPDPHPSTTSSQDQVESSDLSRSFRKVSLANWARNRPKKDANASSSTNRTPSSAFSSSQPGPLMDNYHPRLTPSPSLNAIPQGPSGSSEEHPTPSLGPISSSGTSCPQVRYTTPITDDPIPIEFLGPPSPPPKTPPPPVVVVGSSSSGPYQDRRWIELREIDMPRWLKGAKATIDVPGLDIAPHLRIKCAARRDMNTRDIYWIVTPNMDYIPEQPGQSRYPEIKRDGLLGIYEWTEHPRNFLPHRPHECMIKRCKPDDMTGIFTRQLDRRELEWDVKRNIGKLKPALAKSVEAEYYRVRFLVEKRWAQALSAQTLPHDSRIQAMLTKAHLVNNSMMWKNAVTFWRQWQRCMRDLLAWCDWHDIMVRMDAKFVPEPLVDMSRRGAFTADPEVVKLLACLGIPVWLITTLKGYVPEDRLRPILKWETNPVLSDIKAPSDWATPNLFAKVHDPYGPFFLPLTSNGDRWVISRQSNVQEFSTQSLDILNEFQDVYHDISEPIMNDIDTSHNNSEEARFRAPVSSTSTVGQEESLHPHTHASSSAGSKRHHPSCSDTSNKRQKLELKLPSEVTRVVALLNSSSKPSALPDWAAHPIACWSSAAAKVDFTEARRLHQYFDNHNPVRPDLSFNYVTPPPTIFYHKGNLQKCYLYNWLLVSELWFLLCDADPAKWRFQQNTQAWRNTLSNRSNGKTRAVVLQDWNVMPCNGDLPDGPFQLKWMCFTINTVEELMDQDFLACLMWELSEVNFLYSLLTLDQKLLGESPSTRSQQFRDTGEILIRRNDFLTSWHGRPTLRPRLDVKRGLDAPDSEWQSRKPPLKLLSDFMSFWGTFPNQLQSSGIEEITNLGEFLKFESQVIEYYAQTFTDHFIRPAPLPCMRPPLPSMSV